MLKFLSNALFKGSLTVDNGVTLTNGKNITSTNQLYVLATNYANGIAVGYDSAAVYLGYSMGTTPIHLGSNGSGNLLVRTTGNTIIENGNLLVGTSTNSGYKLDVNGSVRADSTGYFASNGTITAPVLRFLPTNRVHLDPQGYGASTGATLDVAGRLTANGHVLSSSYHMVRGGSTAVDTGFIAYGIGRPDADFSLTALAGMGGYYAGTAWYSGAGLTFYTSNGPDISGGAYLQEVIRVTPAGVMSVTNLSGTGTRMVTASATGVLGTSALPESLVVNNNNEYRVVTGSATANTLNANTKLAWYNDYGILYLEATASWGYGAEIDFDNRPINGTQWGIYGGDPTHPGMVMYRYLPSGKDVSYWDIDRFSVASDVKLGFSSTGSAIGSLDVAIERESAGLVQINNGTTNTYASLKLLNLTATSLAGTGTRMVVASSTGQLSTQALPTGTVTGTGTTNYVSKWTSSTALGNSTIFDDGNGVGIGTATLNAQTRLTVMGSSSYSKSIVLDSTWSFQTSWAMKNGVYSTEFNLGGSTKSAAEGGPGALQISTYNSTTATYRYPITFFANANVSLGGTSGTVPTDNGSTLQVNGSASVSNLAGTGSRMVVASSTGVLSTQAIPSATGLQTAVDTDKTTSASLAVGTTVIKSLSASTYSGVFFDYVVKNGTNVRVGSVVAITNGTAVEFYETLSNDIGTTTGITFSVDLSSGSLRLKATTTATGWTVVVSTRGI